MSVGSHLDQDEKYLEIRILAGIVGEDAVVNLQDYLPKMMKEKLFV